MRVARSDIDPTENVVERAETHRRLVELVNALEEPFRTTLLLRYFDALSPLEIAERLDVPEATVRSRLRRGIGRLRERLDAQQGGNRSQWMSALGVLCGARELAGPSVALSGAGAMFSSLGTGMLLMDAKLKVVFALLVLTGGALLIPRWFLPAEVEEPTSEAVEVALGATLNAGEEDPVQLSSDPAGESRSSIPSLSQPASEPELPSEPQVAPIGGRVLDASAHPLAAHPLRFKSSSGEERQLESDAHGRFLLDSPQSGRIVSASDRHATLLEAVVRVGSEIEPVVVVSRGVTLAGRIVDQAGEPVEGARLLVELPSDYYSNFRVVLDASNDPERFWTSDEEGHFELTRVTCQDVARLVVRRDGFRELRVPVPQVDRTDLHLVLEALPVTGADLVGIVLDARGAAVEGACVSTGTQMVRSAADGSFLFDPKVRGEATELVAVAPGYLPDRAQAEVGTDGPLWPSQVVLRLSGVPLELEGVVVDENGNPLPAKRVWLADGTLLGIDDNSPVQLEAVLAKIPTKHELEASGESPGSMPNALWNWRSTDAAGHFQFRGLLDRNYVLKVMDTDTLVQVETAPVHPDDGPLSIVFPENTGHREVRGVLRTADGMAAPNVQVGVSRRSLNIEYGQGSSVSWDSSGESTLSNEEGAFRLERVPRTGARLIVHGGGMRYQTVTLDEEQSIDDLQIVVERELVSCHVQVELAGDVQRANSFELVDAEGRSTNLAIVRAGSKVSTTRANLTEGRSMVLRVPEGEYELVLYLGDERVESEWVSVVPGDVVVLRP